MKFLHIGTILSCLFATLSIQAQEFNVFYNQIVQNTSSANILEDLITFEDFGVKEPGTDEIEDTKNWIMERYQSLGYTDIETQSFRVFGQSTSNIIITKTGSLYPNTFVIIDGHYDTVNGPGTNDNGSGTVLILELARLLKNVDTEYSIKFIHFSGEEAGLIGSEFYVNQTVIPQNLDIKLVMNIDQIGGRAGAANNTIVCERDLNPSPSSNNAQSAVVTQEMANCFALYSNLQTEISYAYGSDYMPFERNGEIITGIYEKNESSYPHTSGDLLQNMDADYVFKVTQGMLGAALHFAGAREQLAVTDYDLAQRIVISPNPSHGKISIHLPSSSPETVSMALYDSLGKVIETYLFRDRISFLDLSHLSNGIYHAVFNIENQSIAKRIIL